MPKFLDPIPVGLARFIMLISPIAIVTLIWAMAVLRDPAYTAVGITTAIGYLVVMARVAYLLERDHINIGPSEN